MPCEFWCVAFYFWCIAADMHVSMDDTDFDTEIPLLYDQLGYECSQNQEDAGICEDVGVESLDYDPVHSVIHDKIKKRESQHNRKLYGYLFHHRHFIGQNMVYESIGVNP